MITTITALVALMTAIQAAMVNVDYAWPLGRSWALTVSATITDAQLQQAKAPCCEYLMASDGSGKIFRSKENNVFLLKAR